MTLFWHGEYPAVLHRFGQPWRGMLLTGLNLAIGGVVAALAVLTWGGGHMEPTPFVITPLIIAVPITLAQIVLFDAWPFRRLTKSRLWQGVLLLGCTYCIAALMNAILFDFSFLHEAPFYRPKQDPHGYFIAWLPLTALIGSVSTILALVLLDSWPLEKLFRLVPSFGVQPWRGLVLGAFAATLVACLWVGFVTIGGMGRCRVSGTCLCELDLWDIHCPCSIPRGTVRATASALAWARAFSQCRHLGCVDV